MPLVSPSGCGLLSVAVIGLIAAVEPGSKEEAGSDVAERRLELMRERVAALRFRSDRDGFPDRLEAEPVFRYDDLTRGYLDGTVWRLGAAGRPQAIVTAELCRDYYGSGPKVVYDLLSLSEAPFRAASDDVPGWTPPGSAVEMKPLPGGPRPAASESGRLLQMKSLVARFAASQEVDGERLRLRLLPRPIDRYAPSPEPGSDGAAFLFVSGRMPGVLLLVEAGGGGWRYGVGRLSGPSTLALSLDDAEVWKVPPAAYRWDEAYTATNAPAVIPGLDD